MGDILEVRQGDPQAPAPEASRDAAPQRRESAFRAGLGWVIALLALGVAAAAVVYSWAVAALAAGDAEPPSRVLLAGIGAGGFIVLAGGLWLAWRVGTGGWGRRAERA